MRIIYLSPAAHGGCDYYRGILPLTTAKKQGLAEIEIVSPHDFIMGQAYDQVTFCYRMTADVVIIPRSVQYKMYSAIKKIVRKLNPLIKIVVEYDDYVFDVSPMSPHYKDHGTENVEILMPDGTRKKIWEDGVNIDLSKNRIKMGDIRKTLADADMVTTTTKILAEKFREFNKNVKVLPNCVDMKRWENPGIKKVGDNLRLFWAGGGSHYEDWYQLKDVLPYIMDKYKNVDLHIMGQMWESTLAGIDKKRVYFHQWEDVHSYPYKVTSLDIDIGLIPLRESEFNRCKSPIKWIEYAANRIPTIATYMHPYSEMEAIDSENGLYVQNNEKEAWVEALEILINNKDKREAISNHAFQTVFSNFNVENECVKWIDAYRELIEVETIDNSIKL